MPISKLRFLTVALLVGCAAPSVATTVNAQSYQCATSANDYAAGLQSFLVAAVTGTDSASIEDRAQHQLPATTASKVAFVSRSATCRTAAQHFYAALGMTAPTSGVITVVAFKVSNNRYVVAIPGTRVGEFGVFLTFDSKWNLLANVVG